MTTSTITPAERSGQSNMPQGTERAHTLVILVEDRPGSVDRVIGLLRRRRANMQTLVLGRSEQPEVARVTVVVNDSEVALEHLVEQLRKVVDVQQVMNLLSQQMVARELALIKVKCTPENWHEIVERSHFFGAHAIDVAPEAVTFEVTGSEEKIGKLIELLQTYGIREIARSGRVAMAWGVGEEA
ncbi:MAG: acetolactate synthase small subunit [Ktedonobacteraceae bacterium]|nr:acetolactate synthase small subunit [Ktedonobacteraceae bacterium]